MIAENTQLGAGYSIAMRDLEMRGAGEFLGTRQHGYIASVGFHLYTRMLSQAVRQLRQIKENAQPGSGPGSGEGTQHAGGSGPAPLGRDPGRICPG